MNKCSMDHTFKNKENGIMTKEYFRRSILPRMSTFGLWEITTNPAEGFNFHQGRTYICNLNVTDKNGIIGKEGQI